MYGLAPDMWRLHVEGNAGTNIGTALVWLIIVDVFLCYM